MAKKDKENLKIQYFKSVIGYSKRQKAMVRSLGFTKLNQVVEKPDNDSIRGLVDKIPHILRIVD